MRLVVATHAITSSPPKIGIERDGMVYELFVSTLPSPAFTASDVLDLYLHRGSFETVLADEDEEQNADRWYSHTPCGQEFAQILAQWIWNLRLELGQTLSPCDRAPPNLLKLEPSSLRRCASLPPSRSQRLQWRMDLRNSHGLPLRVGFQARLLPSNLMGPCAVLLTVPCILKNGDQSVMAPCAFCMPRASAIAALVSYVVSVKKVAPRSSLGG